MVLSCGLADPECMKATRHLNPPTATRYSRYVPGEARRAGGLATDLLGSWICLGTVLIVVAVAATLTDLSHGTGAVAVLDVIMPGLALAAACLILMATRGAERAADERALRHLDAARRIQAADEEILGELDQMNSGLARLSARIETLNIRCRAAGDAAQDERNRSS